MASLNKVMLIGNAGKDAELRYLSSGTAQSQFSLAVNSRRRGQSGDWEEQTEWFNIVVWAEQAERISQYITKGKQVYVEGRLQTRTWDDDQGVKHYRTEVVAQTIQLLGGPRDSGEGGGGSWGDGSQSYAGSRGGGQRGGYSGPRAGAGDTDPDDLPFE
jgi:single-strand DNA-binding protein